MKRLNAVCCIVALLCAYSVVAQDTKQAAAEGGAQATQGVRPEQQGLEILSDTQGVDFKPYLKDALRQIYGQWLPLLPDEARAPQNKKGETSIRFTINPDGKIAAMHLEENTHDHALNRAAWGAITGVGKFAPLPAEFHGPDLELRIHFLVNQSGADGR